MRHCAPVSVVFLTNVLPAGLRGGGEIVSQSIVEALARAGEDVRVLGYRRPGPTAVAGRWEECVGKRPIETSAAGWRAFAWMAQALATGAPYTGVKYRSRAYVRAARAAVGSPGARSAARPGPAGRPRAVIIDHAHTYFATAAARLPLPPLVFLAHNAESEVYAELAATATTRRGRWVNARESRRIGAVEAALARSAQQIWVLTEADAGYFRTLGPGADVRTLEVTSMMSAGGGAQPAYDVALIGNWAWRPNALGLEWFADEVVPWLPSGMSVEVAGVGAEWLEGRHPNVAVRGPVPDAQEFMSRARAVAVPSVAGGGVQVKTLDAVACGVPVVATPVATRGLRDLPASVAVTDDGARFAEQLARFAAAPEHERLRRDAADWSRARRQALEESVVSWLADLAPPGGGAGPALAVEAASGGPPAEVASGRSPAA
jgi:glycosyltransferase involved in cell wall biosynthesis